MAAVAALALSALLPAEKELPKLCLFNWATGYPCPFCGLTRSFSHISQGNLGEATLNHPLGIPTYLTAALLAGRYVTGQTLDLRMKRAHLAIFTLLLLIAWLVKLVAVPKRYW